MRYSNIHNHTTFSDGKHTMEENVLSAIEKNMLSLGFSDHSFTACDTSYCMKEEDYSAYLQTICQLKEAYTDKLSIFAGMELDYYSELDASDYDYIIASVHYIVKDGICYPIDHSPEQQTDCIEHAFDGDVLAMAQCYFDMLCEQFKTVFSNNTWHVKNEFKNEIAFITDEDYEDALMEKINSIKADNIKVMHTLF